MHDFTNRTFEEIAVGATESVSRMLTATDVEALALAAGDVEGFHLEGGAEADRLSAQGASAIALVAGLLNRRLPGPGSRIVGTQMHYAGAAYVGDRLTATVTAKAKHPKLNRIDFDCRCVNQDGDVLVEGLATVEAPVSRIAYANVATPEFILRRNDGFAKLIARCKALPPTTCAVVHPCDAASLGGAIEAGKRGLIVPILVGPEAKIRAVAEEEGIDLSAYQIVSVEHSHAAAAKSVELARTGNVEGLMKGSLHTDELMAAIVPSATGLRTARRVSHVFVMDVPTYPRLLMVTDAAVNIFPDLECKVDICQNAIDLAHILGIESPKVAILSAVETVNPRIPEHARRRGAVQDGRPRADHRRHPRRPARVRQRDLARGGAHQAHRVSGGGTGGHPAGPGPRGRQHDGEAAAVSRRRRLGGHRARRPRADRADLARGQRAHPAGVDRGAEAARARAARETAAEGLTR